MCLLGPSAERKVIQHGNGERSGKGGSVYKRLVPLFTFELAGRMDTEAFGKAGASDTVGEAVSVAVPSFR